MTREEATIYIKEWLKDEYLDSKDRAALTTIIEEIGHKCHSCNHYLAGEYDGSCGSYICKEYSGWEQEEAEDKEWGTMEERLATINKEEK